MRVTACQGENTMKCTISPHKFTTLAMSSDESSDSPSSTSSSSSPSSTSSSSSDSTSSFEDLRLKSPPSRINKNSLPEHSQKSLAEDIQKQGGINSPQFNLANLRRSKPDVYGIANSQKYRKFESKVSSWRRDSKEDPSKYQATLDSLGIVTAAAKPTRKPRKTKQKTPSKSKSLPQRSQPTIIESSPSTSVDIMTGKEKKKYKGHDYGKKCVYLHENTKSI